MIKFFLTGYLQPGIILPKLRFAILEHARQLVHSFEKVILIEKECGGAF